MNVSSSEAFNEILYFFSIIRQWYVNLCSKSRQKPIIYCLRSEIWFFLSTFMLSAQWQLLYFYIYLFVEHTTITSRAEFCNSSNFVRKIDFTRVLVSSDFDCSLLESNWSHSSIIRTQGASVVKSSNSSFACFSESPNHLLKISEAEIR